MDTRTLLIELFGYLGSALVVVSMLMSSVVKLRVINVGGSIISATYALIIGSIPLVLMNVCLIAINIYNLFLLFRTEKKYDLVTEQANDGFVRYFLERYRDDILQYFPGFQPQDKPYDTAYIVCCNGTPASVLLGAEKEEGTFEVFLDYSTPAYRDCSVGTYLYAKLLANGVKKLVFRQCASEVHLSYLKKMGFSKDNDSYVKTL